MAVGNTFGATALSSYGGFWIGTAIILTPGGFEIISTLEADSPYPFLNSFGLYLMVSRCKSIDRSKECRLTMSRAGSSSPSFCSSSLSDRQSPSSSCSSRWTWPSSCSELPTSSTTAVHQTLPASVLVVLLVSLQLSQLGMLQSNDRSLSSFSMLTIVQVQRTRRYGRLQQLVLPHPSRPLPMVRQGTREAWQGQQRRGSRCPAGLKSMIVIPTL